MAYKHRRYMWVLHDTLIPIPHHIGSMGQVWGGCGKPGEPGNEDPDIQDDSVCVWVIPKISLSFAIRKLF